MSAELPTKPSHLDPSKLGTKEYWDKTYADELKNYEESGDEGSVWFGRAAENRIVRFVTDNVAKGSPIIDLGCANGSVLRRLQSIGFTDLTGVDYSENAVNLAQQCSTSDITIHYQVADLTSDLSPNLAEKFDVLLDKGTWDAISLAADSAKMLQNYRRSIGRLFRPNSSHQQFFVLVSCNFTTEELQRQFAAGNSKDDAFGLHFYSELPAKNSFTFGGSTGRTTTGVVFEWRLQS